MQRNPTQPNAAQRNTMQCSAAQRNARAAQLLCGATVVCCVARGVEHDLTPTHRPPAFLLPACIAESQDTLIKKAQLAKFLTRRKMNRNFNQRDAGDWDMPSRLSPVPAIDPSSRWGASAAAP